MRKGADRWILTIALSLSILGVLMVFSSSTVMTASSADFNRDPYFFVKRQTIFLLLGLAGMLVARRIDLLRWRSLTGLPFMLFSLALLIGVLTVGPEINGAQRWLLVGPFQFQPAEMAKLAMIFYLADCLARRREGVTSFPRLLPALALFGATLYLIEEEPDLGTNIVMAGVFIAMLFIAGARLEHLGAMAASGLMAVIVLIAAKPYRLERLIGFLDPMADTMGKTYQIFQSLLALGSGGLAGFGLGHGHQKYNYLPEMHTDFIGAILGEELGLVGTTSVLLLFLCLLYKGFKIAVNCRRPYLRFLAAGITFQLALQAILNLAVVSGAVPSTGIPLPFVSYGGTSLLFCLLAVGVLLNISDFNASYAESRRKPSAGKRRRRRGATLCSSNEDQVAPISSGSWEREAAGERLRLRRSRMPRPPIAPTLTEQAPITAASRRRRKKVKVVLR